VQEKSGAREWRAGEEVAAGDLPVHFDTIVLVVAGTATLQIIH
jgi:hypothetical protein